MASLTIRKLDEAVKAYLRLRSAGNGRSVEVTINDRGPYVGGRIIDLSDAAAGAIGMKSAGVVPVNVEVVGR